MADYRCSFCGKHQDQVKKLVAGGAVHGVFICDECISLRATKTPAASARATLRTHHG